MSRVYRGATLAERRAERRAALIQATIELIGEHGTAAVTTKRVCERAGLIERYLYESFESRDDLIRAAFDNAIDFAALVVSEHLLATSMVDPADWLRDAVTSALDTAVDNPGLVRLLVENEGNPVLNERLVTLHDSLEQLAAQLLDAMSTHTRTPENRAILANAVVGAAVAVILGWTTGRIEASRDQLITSTLQIIDRLAADGERAAIQTP